MICTDFFPAEVAAVAADRRMRTPFAVLAVQDAEAVEVFVKTLAVGASGDDGLFFTHDG